VSDRTPRDQLVKYLTDAHSIEEQALAQLRVAPDLAGNGLLADVLAEHLPETENHERAVRDRLETLGGSPSTVKDVVMAAGGKGFILFARSQPDTPGKLLAHAYSYEHLELAAYRLLAIVADRAGDTETMSLANDIAEEERLMGERLAACYDEAADDAIARVDPGGVESALTSYLADAHALEQQAITLLGRAATIAGDPAFVEIYERYLEESREHATAVERRLGAHDSGPSTLKDAAMRLGAGRAPVPGIQGVDPGEQGRRAVERVQPRTGEAVGVVAVVVVVEQVAGEHLADVHVQPGRLGRVHRRAEQLVVGRRGVVDAVEAQPVHLRVGARGHRHDHVTDPDRLGERAAGADPDQRLDVVLIEQLVRVDRGGRLAHAGALHGDALTLVGAGEPEHVPDLGVADHVVQIGLGDPFGPQRIPREQHPRCDLPLLGGDVNTHAGMLSRCTVVVPG